MSVIQFPNGKGATANRGEVIGQIIIERTADGYDICHITGVYSERAQAAAYAMIKTLSDLTDRIADSGSAGHTTLAPIHEVVAEPKLDGRWAEEDSNFGTLT